MGNRELYRGFAALEVTVDKSLPEFPGLKILGEVGRGTTGVVYRAQSLQFNRVVALKVLLQGPEAERAVRGARFLREARALGSFADRNIPAAYQVGEHQGQPHYIREFVDGGTFENQVITRSISALEGFRVLAAVAGTVARVHAKGLVHRNLNPSNVLLTADGTAKLIGFGRVGMQTGPEQLSSGAPTVSPEIDTKALRVMLDWLCSNLGEPFPGFMETVRGSVSSAAEFAASIVAGLRE